jgi:hypothetical protein
MDVLDSGALDVAIGIILVYVLVASVCPLCKRQW